MENPYESPREQGAKEVARIYRGLRDVASDFAVLVAGLIGFAFFAWATITEWPGRPAWSDAFASLGCLLVAAFGADMVRLSYRDFKESNSPASEVRE